MNVPITMYIINTHWIEKLWKLSEIKVAIDCIKRGQAPGPDGLSTEFNENMPENVLLPLLSKLYTIIMDKGKLKKKMCQAIICPLYKGKRSRYLKTIIVESLY